VDGPTGVLILVQNLPVPFDRRVWQEACGLRDHGFDVSVICPRSAQHPAAQEELDGIHVHRYRPWVEARRARGFLLEYAVALIAMTWLARRVVSRRRIDVVHACNPPDLLFLVALPLIARRGRRFVFDHHDLSPELVMAKGYGPDSAAVRTAKVLERLTFGVAAVSIATNDSYRAVASSRGGMSPADVFVVRSGPAAGFTPVPPDPVLREGRRFLVGYVGVMGIQEGLDLLLDAAHLVVRQWDRDDVTFALAGDGPEARRLRNRARDMGLGEHVRFLGRVSDAELVRLLSTADVCVNPDEVNPLNDISTMNKVVEYMALGRPVVQFDTREGRVSTGPSARYARPNDVVSFAEEICRLLDDEDLRTTMGAQGRERFEQELAWARQIPRLIAAYERALSKDPWDINVRRTGWWRQWRHALRATTPSYGPDQRAGSSRIASVGRGDL
jgi:glycosyltransferase involved in cell wall biosynthesis